MIFFHSIVVTIVSKSQRCAYLTHSVILKYRATHDNCKTTRHVQLLLLWQPIIVYMSKRKKNTTQQNERKRIKSKREREGGRERERK